MFAFVFALLATQHLLPLNPDGQGAATLDLVFNTAATEKRVNVTLGYDARAFETLAGTCPGTVTAPGSAAFTVPSFGWAVCRVSETAQ